MWCCIYQDGVTLDCVLVSDFGHIPYFIRVEADLHPLLVVHVYDARVGLTLGPTVAQFFYQHLFLNTTRVIHSYSPATLSLRPPSSARPPQSGRTPQVELRLDLRHTHGPDTVCGVRARGHEQRGLMGDAETARAEGLMLP
jgi:hypothetical protein